MLPYSASINAKDSCAVEETVESRKGPKLGILIQDREICVQMHTKQHDELSKSPILIVNSL